MPVWISRVLLRLILIRPCYVRMRQEFIRTSYRKLHKELGLRCLSIQHLDQVSCTCLFLRERLNWLESDSPGNQLRTRNKQRKECSHSSLDISKTIGERNCKFFFRAREQ
ncbi:hypothetical protein J1N35_008739 [Gossypium stocksii]|uniref:Secreted protein n=1 Tax=Gossypium stocksii TaxID=47602 RepID=A0A9D3W9N6_9ROSI|nr:hypothetical protein J1N35_008739 [Gossypium stocksii]